MDPFNNQWPSPRQEDFSDDGMPMDPMDSMIELQDGTFEPQSRARSNTWPLPRPENFVEPTDEGENNQSNCQPVTGIPPTPDSATSSANAKKNSSRRNAWGNLSYADLITKAITTAPDNRLTLSQIYEWMVQNVPYFKDKGDSNSSAGWKNSIRHNLSLHNRFMRVQNEGTGKSSWWMLNPDAKPGKSMRRRAASMETSKLGKPRGRAKKIVEQIRNEGNISVGNILNDFNSSPGSSVCEGLDMFPDSPFHSANFQLSPEFRQRASSNASSVGRLSPIQVVGIDMDNDWAYADDFLNDDYNSDGLTSNSPQTKLLQASLIEELTGALAEDLNLQNIQGFSTASTLHHSHPPPPYQPPQYQTIHQQYMLGQPQTIQMLQQQNNTRESMSPGSINGMSPSYSEQSPDYSSLVNQSRIRPSSNSPPITIPSSQMLGSSNLSNNMNIPNNLNISNHLNVSNLSSSIGNNNPQTLMGQAMGALNPNMDDLSLNFESFQGGLDCNVDEVIKHELSMGEQLEFNFQNNTQNNFQGSEAINIQTPGSHNSLSRGQYPRKTPPSWVH